MLLVAKKKELPGLPQNSICRGVDRINFLHRSGDAQHDILSPLTTGELEGEQEGV
jgi:hypothetical protein